MREFNEPPFIPDYPAPGPVQQGQYGPMPHYPAPQYPPMQHWPQQPYPQPMPGKPWYTSKTLIFNAIVAALGAVEMSAHLIQPMVDANIYAIGMFVLTVGNAVLRLVTFQGLGR